MGAKVRPYYLKFVHLANKGAKDRGYKDYGEFTRSCYDMDQDKFRTKMANLFAKVHPLYKKLHAYVRFKLRFVEFSNISFKRFSNHRRSRNPTCFNYFFTWTSSVHKYHTRHSDRNDV